MSAEIKMKCYRDNERDVSVTVFVQAYKFVRNVPMAKRTNKLTDSRPM